MAQLSQPALSRIITEARLLLNQTKATNSFWSDEELGNYVNDGIRKYFLELISHDEGQFHAVTDLDIVANQETVALPSDFFRIKAVYKHTDTGYQLLRYWNNHITSYDANNNASANNYSPYYYFRENNLVLRPIPGFNETAALRIEYTQLPEQLILGTDTLPTGVSAVFKELIVMYCVYKAKVKESLVTGTDTASVAATLLEDTHRIFKESVSNRSTSVQFIAPFNP